MLSYCKKCLKRLFKTFVLKNCLEKICGEELCLKKNCLKLLCLIIQLVLKCCCLKAAAHLRKL